MQIKSNRNVLWMTIICGLGLAIIALTIPATVDAKGKSDRDRMTHYGWVKSAPDGFHGTWIIGEMEVTTSPRTEFDQTEGPLKVGVCAKIDIRGGMVHEIDSEPARDCS